MLITVLPGFLLLWLWMYTQWNKGASTSVTALVGGVCFTLVALGYVLLFKYPVNMVRLRSYLRILAQNGLPERVAMSEDEDDIAAVHFYLKQIVRHAEERLNLLEERHKAALATERHRIMMESIGALCHYVGQPATVLSLSLHKMRQAVGDSPAAPLVAECQAAFDDITATLDRCRELTHYRTEPYLAANPDGIRIIHLGAEKNERTEQAPEG